MLQVASTKERFDAHQRIYEMGMTMGIESHLLTPGEVAERQLLIDPATVYSGLYTPSSGVVKTSLIATSMRREAEKSGSLTSVANTQVVDIVVEAELALFALSRADGGYGWRIYSISGYRIALFV